MQTVLNNGTFSLKGVAMMGKPPPSKMSLDGVHVGVGGAKWDPENDLISLDIQEVNFAKKNRGKKNAESVGIVPDKLTRKHCASRTGEIFDITGKVAPIIGTFKLGLHELTCTHKLKWDDVLPDNLREVWCTHFEMMEELKSIKFNRAVIPEDAVSEKFHTIDFGDASMKILCVANICEISEKERGIFLSTTVRKNQDYFSSNDSTKIRNICCYCQHSHRRSCEEILQELS